MTDLMTEVLLRQKLKASVKNVVDQDFCIVPAKIRRGVTNSYIAHRLGMTLNNKLTKVIQEVLIEKGAKKTITDGYNFYSNIGILDG
jgi:hypothetical protein